MSNDLEPAQSSTAPAGELSDQPEPGDVRVGRSYDEDSNEPQKVLLQWRKNEGQEWILAHDRDSFVDLGAYQ